MSVLGGCPPQQTFGGGTRTGLLNIRKHFGDVLAWAAQGVGGGGVPSLQLWGCGTEGLWAQWGWTQGSV